MEEDNSEELFNNGMDRGTEKVKDRKTIRNNEDTTGADKEVANVKSKRSQGGKEKGGDGKKKTKENGKDKGKDVKDKDGTKSSKGQLSPHVSHERRLSNGSSIVSLPVSRSSSAASSRKGKTTVQVLGRVMTQC